MAIFGCNVPLGIHKERMVGTSEMIPAHWLSTSREDQTRCIGRVGAYVSEFGHGFCTACVTSYALTVTSLVEL
jgi:hypothetical protein